MSNEKIQELLGKLQGEIKSTEVDEETKGLLHELDADIHQLLDTSSSEGDADSILDGAKLLETKFAVKHPAAERFIREIIDALGKMGV